MGWTIPIEPISIIDRITMDTSYQDVDVSSDVPSGTKHIWIRFRDTGATYYNVGVRAKGSSQTINYRINVDCWRLEGVKLDTDRVFQAYVTSGASLTAHIVAYSDADTLLTTYEDKSIAGDGLTYTTQTATSDIPAGTEIVVLKGVNTNNVVRFHAVRADDETYDYYNEGQGWSQWVAFVPIDSNEEWAQKAESGGYIDYYYIGYLSDAYRITGTPPDKAPGTGGSFQTVDLSGELPVGASAALFQMINNSGSGRHINVRHPSSTESLTADMNFNNGDHRWMIAPLNSSRETQIYLSATGPECRLVGWLESGTSIKTINGLIFSSCKTISGLSIASMKTWNGLS